MKQYTYATALSITTALFCLTACGDSDSSPSTPKDGLITDVQMDSVKTNDDLPNCTEKRQETVAYIKDDSSIRICLDEKWETAESVAATKEDLPSCSKKRETSTAYVLDEHSYYTCTDEHWQKGVTEGSSSDEEEKSSSSKKTDKSSSSNAKSSSSEKMTSSEDGKSSSAEKSSSSTKPEESSSSKEIKPAKASLTALIYDTDASLHPLFSCDAFPSYDNGCPTEIPGVDLKTAAAAVKACVGVVQGIVEITLGYDKKPVLTEEGKKCFIEEKFFNQLFNYTKDVNEVIAWEMPFAKKDNEIWEFNSDSIVIGDTLGGFFPIENTTDDDILVIDGEKLGPITAARTRRKGEAPYFIVDTVDFYHYCNTLGWTGGKDCNGSFTQLADADGFYNMNYGSKHWSGTRNHHFCMEIHGTFTYSDSLEAGFSASGDQWVFIGNKLAVDNGGTHVNAPGFVQMKRLNKTYDSYMKEGKEYPIDIFYCARRTSLSDFSVWTNFAITQD